jgi:hypothetical protein
MIKPLYLDAALDWQVRLDDGPALHISAPGRARSLYPLQRLARVISPSAAQWTTPALLACLRAGVPVIFHDAAGDPIGWCFGPRKRETTLGGLLREAVAHPQGADLIAAWRQAAARAEILAAMRALNTSSQRLDAAAVRAHLCNLHRVRSGQAAGTLLRALRRATAALVAERLHGLLGDPALIAFAREGLHLGHTMCDLLEWQQHRILHATPPHRLTQDGSPGRFAAEAIERHGAALDRCCGELAGSLEHHLREQLT